MHLNFNNKKERKKQFKTSSQLIYHNIFKYKIPPPEYIFLTFSTLFI